VTVKDLRRKADQAWEMAGCARKDGDTADEQKREYEALIREAK
jgi:hypothetical protein